MRRPKQKKLDPKILWVITDSHKPTQVSLQIFDAFDSRLPIQRMNDRF